MDDGVAMWLIGWTMVWLCGSMGGWVEARETSIPVAEWMDEPRERWLQNNTNRTSPLLCGGVTNNDLVEVDVLVLCTQAGLAVKPHRHPGQCAYALTDRQQVSLCRPGVVVDVVPAERMKGESIN